MKEDKKYDAVKEARKIREQLSDEYYKDPKAFFKAVKEAGDKFRKERKEKKTK